MQKIWRHKPQNHSQQKDICRTINIHPIIAQLLINRGLNDPKNCVRFLNSTLNNFHDPFIFNDMGKAAARIKQAVKKKEKIVIYGDYDADGITATAILYRFLKKQNAAVDYYIPHRLDEGYGINQEALEQIKTRQTKLLISVDCGITAVAEIEYLNRCDIDAIITDHHQPRPDKLPPALAILNPLVAAEPYPDKNLAGVGVAYKLICALSGKTEKEFLDLAALGTVCDVVPLIGENRIIVQEGLKKLSRDPQTGIKALIEAAGIRGNNISAYHLGYILGPRVNASGRMSSADLALKLLLTDDPEEAAGIAKTLDEKNRSRQQTEEKILKEAILKLEREINFLHHQVIVLHDKQWHPGVIGIVASRLADRFYRPTLLFGGDDAVMRGSGRSIKKFHLYNALAECKALVEDFGGHEYAVGVTIHSKNMEEFKKKINAHAKKTLSGEDLLPSVDIDMEIPLDVLSADFIRQMEKLEPFGRGNPRPAFSTQGIKFKGAARKIGRSGFKIWVTDDKLTCEAISFKGNDLAPLTLTQRSADILYTPCLDHWQGVTSIMLQLSDIRVY